ncbi:MAG TPA: hypothetical protein PLP05_03685 [Sedimentisphaerales bacterium]|nr:hypothetical protein [Sedimentisphaerales bacterium]
MFRTMFVFFILVSCSFTLFASWNIKVVDDGGEYCSLEVINGQPAISYQGDSGELKYARYNGSNWDYETSDDSGILAQSTSLTAISDGNPAIAYWEYMEDDLKYAWYDGSAWHNTILESTGVTGKYTSLAIIGGQPAISYYNSTGSELKYARFDGSVWQITTVVTGAIILNTSMIALPDGNPAIVYYDNYKLKYAWFDGSVWQNRIVDSASNIVGMYASMALLPSGRPAISYYDYSNKRLKYAWLNDADAWVIEIVDDGPYSLNDVGKYSSLAILPNGNPAISYYDNYSKNLWFALFDDGEWNLTKIDGYYESEDGLYSSLAVLSDNTLGISYHQGNDYVLKFARTDTAIPSALLDVDYTTTAWTERGGEVNEVNNSAQSRVQFCGGGETKGRSGGVSSYVYLESDLPGNYSGVITLSGQACDMNECIDYNETTWECLEWQEIHEEPNDANGKLQMHIAINPSPAKPIGSATYLFIEVLRGGEDMGASESMYIKIYRNGELVNENIQETAYIQALVGDSLDVVVDYYVVSDGSYDRQANINIRILDNERTSDMCSEFSMEPDGSVDFFDLACLAANWLESNCTEPDFCNGADLNYDLSVDLLDFAFFADDWLVGFIPGQEKFYELTMDTDPGWTTEGLWAFGQPTGQGGEEYGGPDPVSGYTGNNVYGYNLEGNYTDNLSETHLTSTAIDCSGRSNVRLKFWRWLGVEYSNYDHAYIQISNNGTDWVVVWQNDGEVIDLTWKRIVIDISAVADNQATVYLRWTMGSTDDIGAYCGWNVDDIQLWGNP